MSSYKSQQVNYSKQLLSYLKPRKAKTVLDRWRYSSPWLD